MICLTGDVHHASLRTLDAKFCRGSEIDAALVAAQITLDYGINYTLFLTGLCAEESPRLIRKIATQSNIEVGGHNYYAFKQRRIFSLYRMLTGLRNGPYAYQKWEVRKTTRILEKVARQKIFSWRDHAFRNDRNTINILQKCGITHLSDKVSGNGAQPTENSGIVEVIINTIPDHNYVYHGSRQPGKISDEHILRQSSFKTGPMSKREWLDRIKSQVHEIESRGGVSVILAHPACAELMDDFKTFRELCDFLADFNSVKMRDIVL
jgi:hypothetical protein